MSKRFDTALLEREETRMKLAAALDAKYASEQRSRNFGRFSMIAIAAVAGYYACTSPLIETIRHPPKRKMIRPNDMLAQLKKQIQERDAMLIGEDSPAPDTLKPPAPAMPEPDNVPVAAEAPAEPQPRKEPRFARGKIPLNLYSDLNRGSDLRFKAPSYGKATAHGLGALEPLARRTRRRPFRCDRYRPATPADLAKIPARRPRSVSPLYARLASPPARLAPDEREFPKK